MAGVYTTLFAAWVDLPVYPTPRLTAGPPAGTIWVIRDIMLYNGSAVEQALGGAYVIDEGGVMIYAVLRPFAMGAVSYHWDGRQVIQEGTELEAAALEDGWSCRITGFQLTLP